jgi:hypothetical protein
MASLMRLSFCCWLIFTFSFCSLRAQCDATRLINDYVVQLDDYNFLKGYKFVDPKPVTNEFSYVFTKGTSYQITLCLEDRKKRDVEIMVFDRARNLVASNASNKSKKKNVLEFTCSVSGIYYMQYNFKDETNFCGASVLTFKRK